ncbi:MAG: TPR repeat protein [Parasphingorhabdus sp.]|jgi:TPR repeat protein
MTYTDYAARTTNGIYAEAIKWYRQAAEKGFAKAQFSLGQMYDFGIITKKDNVYAYKWFNLAAAQGYEGAIDRRELLSTGMTDEQITEAQRLSQSFIPRGE